MDSKRIRREGAKFLKEKKQKEAKK
jgi:hypothetical protein